MKPALPLTELEHDMLTEVATIGAGHAAGPIAALVQHPVDVQVPELRLHSIEEVAAAMGEAEREVTVTMVKIQGDANGLILLILDPDHASRLVHDIAGGQDASALEEVTNIFAGASLGALAKFLGLQLLQSVPGSATDALRAVINESLAELGSQTDQVLLLRTGLAVPALQVQAQLFFVFDPASSQTILRATHQHARGQS